MHSDDCRGCREYEQLSRRQFLGSSAGATIAGITAPAWLPRVAFARDDCASRDVIVSIFLRGGCDGLTLCVPHGENAYYNKRPNLAVPRPDSGDPNAAIDLDGFFGFPLGMSPLLEAFQSGDLAIVHACGFRDATRSHFDAMRFVEVGTADDPTLFTGWLGRHMLSTPPLSQDALIRAISLGFALPQSLVGGPQALPVAEPSNYGLTGRPASLDDREALLAEQYALVGDPQAAAAENTLATIDLLEQIDFDGYQPRGNALYQDNEFGRGLRAAAALIRADVGVEAISLDIGGWDTHDQQGSTTGFLNNLMQQLSTNLAAFHADIIADDLPVTLVAMSEFGRNVDENGSQGTDHGFGNCMFAMGHQIAGGQVITRWPGLNTGELFEGRDLEITIDYRDVLGEIIHARLKNPDLAAVFPDYAPKFRGVTRCDLSATGYDWELP